MKKSEALTILGLAADATDAEVKRAHRKLVVAHHPDKFPLGSAEHDQAEEMTKRINEARDVLLNRTWTPEFDPRRDPRPYAGNPFAHPSAGAPGAAGGAGGPFGGGAGADPFAGWPFGPGQTTFVWTSWDGTRSSEGASSDGAGRRRRAAADSFPSDGFGFDPFDPFAPFWAAAPRKTPEQKLADAREDLRQEALAVAGKAVLLAAGALFATPAAGLFIYVMASLAYGLWKRLGSCLLFAIVPLAVLAAPLLVVIAPRQGAVTVGLFVAFAIAVLLDARNLRDLARAYRAAKRAAPQAS